MGKLNNTKTKQKKNQQESQQQQQEIEDQYDEQDINDEDQQYEDDFLIDQKQVDYQEILIEKINHQIQNTQNQGQKLTWVALKKLVNQQYQLEIQMDKEIQLIQRKYQALKSPLADKIADVIAGTPVQKQLYKSQQTVNINPNKQKPQKIQNFWTHIMLKSQLSSFMDPSFDLPVLQACTKITSKIIDYPSQRIFFSMHFDSKKNDIFSHQQISIQMCYEKSQQIRKNYVIIQKPEILQCKKQPTKESLFNTLFTNDCLENRMTNHTNKYQFLIDGLWQFHNIYISVLKSYFSHHYIGQDLEQDQQNDQQIDEEKNQNQQKDQGQQQDNQDSKPSKKINI